MCVKYRFLKMWSESSIHAYRIFALNDNLFLTSIEGWLHYCCCRRLEAVLSRDPQSLLKRRSLDNRDRLGVVIIWNWFSQQPITI